MTATDWCDDRGDRPPVKFGRKARQWFERKIRAQFKTSFDKWGDEEQVALVVAYYLERVDRYVIWVDAAEWHGPGFSNGYWSYLSWAVDADVAKALHARDRALDALRFPSLDEWLEAEANGWLYATGEEGGAAYLAEEERETMHARSISRSFVRDRRRTCRCGASFIVGRRDAKRCDKCRRAAARPGDGRRMPSPHAKAPAGPKGRAVSAGESGHAAETANALAGGIGVVRAGEHPLFTAGRASAAAEMIEFSLRAARDARRAAVQDDASDGSA